MAASAANLRVLLPHRCPAGQGRPRRRLLFRCCCGLCFPGHISRDASGYPVMYSRPDSIVSLVPGAKYEPDNHIKQNAGSAGLQNPQTNLGDLHCRTDASTELLIGKLKDATEMSRMMRETLQETCERANHLLERLDEEDFAMLEKGLDDAWKDLALYEKELDDFAEAVGSCKVLQPEALQKIQMYCNELDDLNKTMRQTLKELSDNIEKVKTLNKHMKRELSSYDEILETLWKHVKAVLAVALGSCILLILMAILLGIFI